MLRYAIAPFLATLAAAAPVQPADHPPPCPEFEVDVTALRFREGPPAWSFMVTNKSARPIFGFILGSVGDTFIDISFATVPTSVGSPNGWEGQHVFGQDPRQPGRHSFALISYLWLAKGSDARIQPGQALSGFSIQLPDVEGDGSVGGIDDKGNPEYPDLAEGPFKVLLSGRAIRCPTLGNVRPDRGSPASPAAPPKAAGSQGPAGGIMFIAKGWEDD